VRCIYMGMVVGLVPTLVYNRGCPSAASWPLPEALHYQLVVLAGTATKTTAQPSTHTAVAANVLHDRRLFHGSQYPLPMLSGAGRIAVVRQAPAEVVRALVDGDDVRPPAAAPPTAGAAEQAHPN